MPYQEESRLPRQRPASFVSPRTLACIDTGAAFEANGWLCSSSCSLPSCLLPLPALAVGWKAVGSPVGSSAVSARTLGRRTARRNSHTGLDPPRQGTWSWSHGGVYCVKERGQEQPPLAELGKRRFTGAYERQAHGPATGATGRRLGARAINPRQASIRCRGAAGNGGPETDMACKPIPAW
ncbi:uncharacterized protein P884DRAFT_276065 [Thermothelomyces heterothallicus CBS 202.75]|uniref:uncharacterized protein n=1 Tax=Thermothelomyces heterothallicus CBS 202.75 TaxID=1149848 RepID=UPI0037422087